MNITVPAIHKPTVLICTHDRIDITSVNIKLLLSQSVVPHIILVVSSIEEYVSYSKKFPKVKVIKCSNNPLGAKWQTGVNEAKNSCADPLIILGSDDILGNGYIANALKIMETGIHFIGLRRWYSHYKGKAYLIDYNPITPIGGGRVYTKHILEKIGYNIFNKQMNKHLDSNGWERVLLTNFPYVINPEGLDIHAIKGEWGMLNPFDLNHRSVKLISVHDSKKILPELYEIH